jgi:hypothetical protein
MYASFEGAKIGHNPDRIGNPYQTKKHGGQRGNTMVVRGTLKT